MKKMLSLFSALAMAAGAAIPISAAAAVTDADALADAVKRGGEITLGASFDIDRLRIDSNITIDGQDHILTNANADVSQATLANKSDGVAATLKNIILDGGGRTMTDTCLWMGRGSWDWYNVTAHGWKSSSSGNRGALTLGKSANSPGMVNMHSSTITGNHLGLSLDQSETVANIYGCVIENNDAADINITSVR